MGSSTLFQNSEEADPAVKYKRRVRRGLYETTETIVSFFEGVPYYSTHVSVTLLGHCCFACELGLIGIIGIFGAQDLLYTFMNIITSHPIQSFHQKRLVKFSETFEQ